MGILNDQFIQAVLYAVSQIPVGRVSTYGRIAAKIGKEKNARLVGRVMSLADLYGDYPCHRVVNSHGRTVPGWTMQRLLLEEEGVRFRENGRVDLQKHLW